MPALPKILTAYLRLYWPYLAIFSLVSLSVIAIAVQNYREIDRELTEAALSRRASVAQLAAATLSERFSRLVDLTVSLATRVKFRELVAAGQWSEASRIMHDVPRDFPFVDRLFLSDVNGVLMADVPELAGVRGKNFSFRDWYEKVRQSSRPYVSPVYRRSAVPQRNVIAVAAPIKNANGHLSGILVMQLQLGAFFGWAKGVDAGHEGFMYLVDQKGRVAFHSDTPIGGEIADLSSLPVVRKVLRGQTGVESGFDPIEEEKVISAYAPVAGYGWGVVVQQPARAAYASKNDQLKQLRVAYGVVLLFFLLVAYLVPRLVLQRRQTRADRRMKAELERRVTERTAQLEAANKELNSFAYSVSHDLRSPLRAVDGFSRMLEEDYADKLDHEGRRLLGVIRHSSQNMGQLIDDLLAFSRLGRQPVALSEVDMTTLAADVLKQLDAAADPRLTVHLAPMPPARGDVALLRQVWMNLLTNAIKFSAKRDHPLVEISGRDEGHEVVYCVKDNGAGFDMRYYDKLFGVFQRLHSADEFGGTGVGLAIVQRVVVKHGGRAWAEGEPDRGAAFYFSLPKEKHDG